MSRYSFIENKIIGKAIEKRRYAERWGYRCYDAMVDNWVNNRWWYWWDHPIKDHKYWRRERSGSRKAMKKYSNRRIRGMKDVYGNGGYRKIVNSWMWID